MDRLRSFTSANRSVIVNIIYVIAFLVVMYYLYKFLMEGSGLEQDLLNVKLDASDIATVQSRTLSITHDADNRPTGLRINQNGEYTISMWVYISNYDYRAGRVKPVFTIADAGKPTSYLMTGFLYPNEAKMGIRTHTMNASTDALTNRSKYTALVNSTEIDSDMAMCDLKDVDMQRWVHIAVTVNGRIMDVYMDGKLARSCILPGLPDASISGAQTLVMGPNGGFGGYVCGVQFFGYAATPDRIYTTYQGGPYATTSFLTYVAEKVGFKFLYTGADGAKKSTNI